MPLRSRGPDPEVERFSAALRRLDESAFADFVADLWEARGRSVTRDGTVLSVDSPGERCRLRVTHGEPTPARDGRTRRLVVTGASENTHSLASLVERVASLPMERMRTHPLLEPKPVRGAPRA